MREKMCDIKGILFFVIFAGFSLSSWKIEAFNIEARHYTSYTSESKSMFGFSVAEYRDKNRRGWVIVGAPEAQTSQPNIYRGGAVFRCDLAIDDRCIPIDFDGKDNSVISYNDKLIQMENKTLQWFGATVSTSMKDGGPILACAPRYIYFGMSMNNEDGRKDTVGSRREPVGTCYVSNLNNSTEYSPCRTRKGGYHRQGSCQAGLGATVSKDGERIFIGAPGSWYWQGQLYSIMRRMDKFPFVPPGEASFGVFKGQTYEQILADTGKVMSTKEGPATEDDSYLGYSITRGDFIGNGDSGSAVGMPRGYGLLGKVILFTSNMKNYQNITGEQMGGYFGYALATGDLDGDGLDDLIVGAPMYTIPDNPEMNFETGRIYIFYGKGPKKYREFTTRDGESNRGRFGLSLASLGDVDRDGYGDFAVGAPYAGAEGRGAVYIYQGSREGVSEKYSQVIHAEDLSTWVQTFGFSLTGGLDLDGNLYPDMVVGSYESATAMYFRSRVVIKMVPEDTYVQFGLASKLISLEDQNCILSDKTRVTCLDLKGCFKYTGDGVLSNYNFTVQYILDVKKSKNPRLFFIEHEGKNTMNQSISVDRNDQYCRTVRVYVTPNIRDKLTSLDAEMRMSLTEDRWVDDRPRDPRLPLRPVLARTSSRKDTLSIRKNCGSDNICTPDLQLKCTSNVNRYLLGSANRLELDVLVQNLNEDAFEATYNLVLPFGVDYINIERTDKTAIPVQCSAPKMSNNNTLRCDIGNPLPKGNVVRFKVLLQPFNVHEESSYEFEMFVNSTNPEPVETMYDNHHHLSVEIWVETDLRIEGETKPKELYYTPENYTSINVTTEVEYGPAFIHNYTIRNYGPSRVEEAEVFLIWPAATLAGDDFVYLLEQPETSAPLVCASANANPLSLKLEQRRRLYHYQSSGTVNRNRVSSQDTLPVQTGFEVSSDKTVDQSQWNENSQQIHNQNSNGGSRISSGSHRVESSGTSSSQVSGSSSQSSESSFDQSFESSASHSSDRSSGKSSHQSSGQSSLSGGNRGNQIAIHTETGASIGVGDSSLGVLPPGRGSTILDNSHAISQQGSGGGAWQGGHTFIEKNETHSFNEGLGGIDSSRDDRFIHRGGVSTSVNVKKSEEEKRFELRKQYEENRRREEEQRNLIEQKRAEEERTRLRKEQLLLKTQKEEEEERIRQLDEDDDGRIDEEESEYEEDYEEDHSQWSGDSKGRQDGISGDREETIESHDFGDRLRNITSTQDLQKFLATLKNTIGYEVYNRQGSQYLQFLGRSRTSADGKEYIEFKDGSMFPLQNKYGEQSYSSLNGERDLRFLKLDGQIMVGEDGRTYCRLNDNKRFPLQTSWTHSEERTYSSGGGARESGASAYGSSWRTESGNRGSTPGRQIETYESRSHEEKRTIERKHDVKTSDRNAELEKFYRQNPNYEDRRSRFKRKANVDNVIVDGKYEKVQRSKREAFDDYDQSKISKDQLAYLQNQDSGLETDQLSQFCKSNKCAFLKCTLGRLEKDQEVSISAKFRIKGTTLKKNALDAPVKTSTQLIAKVTKHPFIGKPLTDVIKSHEVSINVIPTAPASSPDPVPLWVVVLSACAGTIILLLLIYLLHKCGFFKRNRPTDAPERQPLNRNGHFNADDH